MNLALFSFVAAGLVGVAGMAAFLRLRRKPPEKLEQERRQRISAKGRIIDGTVIDVAEVEQEDGRALQLLIYRYDVGGVSYEAAQDVTMLRQHLDLHSCRVGLPTSVKYDPQNPGNSIVVAEDWMGLRG